MIYRTCGEICRFLFYTSLYFWGNVVETWGNMQIFRDFERCIRKFHIIEGYGHST